LRINWKVFSETLAFPFTSLDLSRLCSRVIVEDMDMDMDMDGDVVERRVDGGENEWWKFQQNEEDKEKL